MPEPILTVSGLRKAFGALHAIDDVSMALHPGEIHALIGPNGAGKSTLISLVTGWVRPDRGTVTLAGRDITKLSVARRAQLGLGRTFQVSSLAMALSARANVMLAVQGRQQRPFNIWRRVHDDPTLINPALACLRQVGLESRAPVPAAALSHGERRQLELACALALQPKAFLLDEPMAGLDAADTTKLVELLSTMKTTAPILLVEHDMAAVFALADRVSVLVQGQLLTTGSVADIRADPRVRDAYLGTAT